MGIAATVVRDSVYVEDELVEDTFDWFAQDRDGNVWYLGEDSREIEGGEVVSTEGSWEAGVDGALPGIVMPAEPGVGDAYRQEYDVGEAEDMFEVVAVGGAVEVPVGSFEEVVMTRDWTPLEPEVIEEKQYAPGVGKLREEKTAGGDDLSELVESPPALTPWPRVADTGWRVNTGRREAHDHVPHRWGRRAGGGDRLGCDDRRRSRRRRQRAADPRRRPLASHRPSSPTQAAARSPTPRWVTRTVTTRSRSRWTTAPRSTCNSTTGFKVVGGETDGAGEDDGPGDD